MADQQPSVRATVLITTRNRRDELRQALRSAIVQSVPVEVLVIDDGSSDGTSEMVRAEFPGVRLLRHETSRGLVVRRNEGISAASGEIVFSIDDDAAFTSPEIVRHTLQEFSDDRIGAVAMPYIDVNRNAIVNQRAPGTDAVFVIDRFIGTAHALRRDVFLRLGGYRGMLVHQGEEGDYCLRMIEHGYLVRLGTADPIHHFESARRDFWRMDYYGCRNAVLFAWQNIPFPAVLLQVPLTIAGLLSHTWQPRRLATRLRGVLAGLAACATANRLPIDATTYTLWRRLRQASPPLTLAAIAPQLDTRR